MISFVFFIAFFMFGWYDFLKGVDSSYYMVSLSPIENDFIFLPLLFIYQTNSSEVGIIYSRTLGFEQ